jgi:hypothetical protein
MYPRTPGLIPQSGTKGPFLLLFRNAGINACSSTVLDTATLVPLIMTAADRFRRLVSRINSR